MKSIRYIPLVIVFLFVAVIPVSAQIDDLYVMALEYYNETCFDKEIKKEKALLCYLFEKTEDLNNRVVVLENQTPSSVKQIYVYDDDGNELGIYMGDSQFFYEPLERMVRVNSYGLDIPNNPIYFESNNCIGTPYHVGGEALRAFETNSLWLGGKDFINNEEYYYIINPDNYDVGLDSFSNITQDWLTFDLTCHTDDFIHIDATHPLSGEPQRAYAMEKISSDLIPENIVHPAFPLKYKAK